MSQKRHLARAMVVARLQGWSLATEGARRGAHGANEGSGEAGRTVLGCLGQWPPREPAGTGLGRAQVKPSRPRGLSGAPSGLGKEHSRGRRAANQAGGPNNDGLSKRGRVLPTQSFIVGDAEHGQTDTDDTVFSAEAPREKRQTHCPGPAASRGPQPAAGREASASPACAARLASTALWGTELCLRRPSQLGGGRALATFLVTATGKAAQRFSEPALHSDD